MRSLCFLASVWLLALTANAQSDSDPIRKNMLSENQLEAAYFNTLSIGAFTHAQPNSYDASGMVTYPTDTDRRYLQLIDFLIGARVPDATSPGDSIAIVMAPFSKNSSDEHWGFKPMDGYINQNLQQGFARASEPNSWPASWPHKFEDMDDPGWAGSWPGVYGKDYFLAEEFFYRVSDNSYTKFSETGQYVPQSSNPSRGGIGLEIDVHIVADSQVLTYNSHQVILDIHNVSDIDLNDVAIGIYVSDLIAGNPGNDLAEQVLESSVGPYLRFSDQNRQQFPIRFEGAIGIAGIQTLETPLEAVGGSQAFSSSHSFGPGSGTYDSSDDQDLWNRFLMSGQTISSDQDAPDHDHIFGMGTFSIAKNSSKRFAFTLSVVQTMSSTISSDISALERSLEQSAALYQSFQEPVSLLPEKQLPFQTTLDQNYPNPFNPSTTIAFSLAEASFTSLAIHDLLGRKVKEVLATHLPSGTHRYRVDLSSLPSGVYIYSLKTGSVTLHRKMLLLK